MVVGGGQVLSLMVGEAKWDDWGGQRAGGQRAHVAVWHQLRAKAMKQLDYDR